MTSLMTDTEVEAEIRRVETEVETWVKSRDLWHDCGFRNYNDYFDAEPWPGSPVATIFVSDGDFNRIFDGGSDTDELYEEFTSLLERLEYWFERDTGRVYLYSVNPRVNDSFRDYFHWQWVCGLLKPDFNDVHHELFELFSKNPERLNNLKWRDFEILIYELLRNQGFHVDLGPGRGDGGIDIRALQRDPIGDLMTGVQVKRYRPDRKITLQAVQALHGAAMADNMQASIFVTTSDYFPSARHFAGRQNVPMTLCTSADVRKWCAQTTRGIIEDKSLLVSPKAIENTLEKAKENSQEYVVHASVGVTMAMNSFAVLLKEAKHAALLMEVPRRIVEHDGYEQRGCEVPNLTKRVMGDRRVQRIFRAKKAVDGKRRTFWTGRELYSSWDGQPLHFDHCD